MLATIQSQSVSRHDAEEYALPFALISEERLALLQFEHVHSSLSPATDMTVRSGLSLWLGQYEEPAAYLSWHWQYTEGIGIYIASMDDIMSNLVLVDDEDRVMDVYKTAFKWWMRVESLNWRPWAQKQLPQ